MNCIVYVSNGDTLPNLNLTYLKLNSAEYFLLVILKSNTKVNKNIANFYTYTILPLNIQPANW